MLLNSNFFILLPNVSRVNKMHLATVKIPRLFCLTAIVLLMLCNIMLIVLKVIPLDQKIELLISIPKCYQFPKYSIITLSLDDIQSAQIKPDNRNSIFFLITACSKNVEIELNARYFGKITFQIYRSIKLIKIMSVQASMRN